MNVFQHRLLQYCNFDKYCFSSEGTFKCRNSNAELAVLHINYVFSGWKYFDHQVFNEIKLRVVVIFQSKTVLGLNILEVSSLLHKSGNLLLKFLFFTYNRLSTFLGVGWPKRSNAAVSYEKNI